MKRILSLIATFFMILSVAINGQDGKKSSQFLFESFSEAQVLLKNGQVKKLIMNYNVISGTMMISQNNKLLNLSNPELVDTVFIGGGRFIPFEGYFLECYGNGLFVQYKGSLMSPPKQAGYGSTSQTASVTSLTTVSETALVYDFKLPDGYTVDVMIVYNLKRNGLSGSFVNERQLIKLLPGKAEEIKLYKKENNTDFKKPGEVSLLINSVLGL